MKRSFWLFFSIAVLAFSVSSCAKDDDENDLTFEIVGDYIGDYVDIDQATTNTLVEVTKVSNTRIKISNPGDNLFAPWEADIIMPTDNTITSGVATAYAVSFLLVPDPVSFGFTRDSGETFAGDKQ